MTKTNSITGTTLTDHTVDTPTGTVAGFLVRKFSRTLGYVWTQGGVWNWRSEGSDLRASVDAAFRTVGGK